MEKSSATEAVREQQPGLSSNPARSHLEKEISPQKPQELPLSSGPSSTPALSHSEIDNIPQTPQGPPLSPGRSSTLASSHSEITIIPERPQRLPLSPGPSSTPALSHSEIDNIPQTPQGPPLSPGRSSTLASSHSEITIIPERPQRLPLSPGPSSTPISSHSQVATDVQPPPKGLLSLALEIFKNAIVATLLVTASLSIGFDIFSRHFEDIWSDAVSIIVVVLLVVIVSTVYKYKHRHLHELEISLNKLTSALGKIGLATALLFLVVSLVRYLIHKSKSNRDSFIDHSATSITMVWDSVVLHLVVALIIDYSTKKGHMVAVTNRCSKFVYAKIQKFIQFQLTVNAVVLFMSLLGAIHVEVPLISLEFMWVNIVITSLGNLALSSEGPNYDLMEEQPLDQIEPLITKAMWRNIIAQSIYQILILMTIQLGRISILHEEQNMVVFNTFVLCVIFTALNARELEKKNIFEGLLYKNKPFVAIMGMAIFFQVVIMESAKRLSIIERRLGWVQWAVCISFASFSLLIGWVVKWVPVSRFRIVWPGATAAHTIIHV